MTRCHKGTKENEKKIFGMHSLHYLISEIFCIFCEIHGDIDCDAANFLLPAATVCVCLLILTLTIHIL